MHLARVAKRATVEMRLQACVQNYKLVTSTKNILSFSLWLWDQSKDILMRDGMTVQGMTFQGKDVSRHDGSRYDGSRKGRFKA